MKIREDFVALILTHGRAERVHTYRSLRKQGYTGRIVIVIDDEDETAPDYHKLFDKDVYMFNKKDAINKVDIGDNFSDSRGVLYARTESFRIAKELGYRYFIMLDDDYIDWTWKIDDKNEWVSHKPIKNLDNIFNCMVDFLSKTPFITVCLGQTGELQGGRGFLIKRGIHKYYKFKAMNTWVCDVEKPFKFFGRVNEDVNLYTYFQRQGNLVITLFNAVIIQKRTQANAGGLTELYLDQGTYVKSFYSVMYAPSCVKVYLFKGSQTTKRLGRLHHKVRYNNTVPKIVEQIYQKAK